MVYKSMRDTRLSWKAIVIAALLVAVATGLGVFAVSGAGWFDRKEAVSTRPAVIAKAPHQAKCPLCGLPAADPIFIARRPVAVKIENDPAARPQAGLSNACVVYEEECEGSVTRFLAVYMCRDTDPVGPVRSARPADIEIAFPYNALFCHCGGGEPILALVRSSGLPDLDQQKWPGAFWRSSAKRAPHNLFSSTGRLRQAGEKEYPYQGQAAAPFKFLSDWEQARMEQARSDEIKKAQANQADPSPAYAPAMTVVRNVHIPYETFCAVDYAYDPGSGRFMRSVRGAPHIDGNTGGQVAADTVIVQYVMTTPSGFVDVNGADTPNLGLIGSGRAQVFVRGRVIDANWSKPSRAAHTVFTDSLGKEIRVKPGTTWVELVPSTKQATFN
jgi:hypothetical protein